MSGRKVMGTIGSLGNASNLSVQGCRMRHCLFMFNYMVVRQKDRFRIRSVQIDNL